MRPTGAYVYFESEDAARGHLCFRGFVRTATPARGGKWDYANPKGTVEARIGRDECGSFLEYRGVNPADDLLAGLSQIHLPVSDAGCLFGVSRATVYRWAKGATRIPETARRLLQYEVEACSVGRHGATQWQGFRNDQPMGPPCDTKAEAFWHALDLPR